MQGDDDKRRCNNKHWKDLCSKAQIKKMHSQAMAIQCEAQQQLDQLAHLVEHNTKLEKEKDALRKQN
jgi:hypothetical protein